MATLLMRSAMTNLGETATSEEICTADGADDTDKGISLVSIRRIHAATDAKRRPGLQIRGQEKPSGNGSRVRLTRSRDVENSSREQR